MHRFRSAFFFLRGWLVLSLALAPLLALQAAPVASVTDGTHVVSVLNHGSHSGHAQHVDHGASHPGCQDQHSCQGSYCSHCGHCAGVMTLFLDAPTRHRPVLTPYVPELVSFPDFPRRERPPRLFFS